ncbi:hypothetical protein A2686_00440 [Candidatus Woesebacteria bacterium RIFCSPHIGHO2_01_FULL_38_10]|uniref:DNA repair protein RadA n=1 Tax=Candidatus Woesebacteria bacterium RIFCSPLOWO2_01_FULL_39_10b TaxID=1802517 RepID=A0A1F8B4U8_9BACT|nr:MAG: hypothetical protein A2686_00440 [Candidatus Woesebacteria bacterium RIFCSPHIGHO2_01_FULL_38_10]OGM59017.1 MAG: hypothetical protein A2892_05265 [Candidatus Woesebacteria bacterium RIFCSPLOWO2_01_FULL_39_10b]
MVRKSLLFVCQQCGYSQVGWAGKCPECGSWNSLVETVQEREGKRAGAREKKTKTELISLASVPIKSTLRISTKISEFDRVLGGGLVCGQVVLIAGEPGIGKSTLLLQAADKLATRQDVLGNSKKGKTGASSHTSRVLYVSGEESVSQTKLRADRLGIKNKNIVLLEETDVDRVLDSIELMERRTDQRKEKKESSSVQLFNSSTVLIVDSIQTMTTSDLSGMAGSVGQIKECTYRLVRQAKSKNIPIFVVGHVTKEGTVAGPAVLMHIVDTVLWFEGDKSLTFRLLRAVKNRFGPTDEVGVFSMQEQGLESVNAPEKVFLSKGRGNVSGIAVASIMEGTRPILVEIQSLIVPTKLAFPRRVAQGIDSKRFELLLAVLTRRSGIPLYENDCFLNVSGGISIKNDPSGDLAICLSLASAYLDKPLPVRSVSIGEVSLLGDIREVVAQEKRIKEAKRLGYKTVISNREVGYLQEAIKKYLK